MPADRDGRKFKTGAAPKASTFKIAPDLDLSYLKNIQARIDTGLKRPRRRRRGAISKKRRTESFSPERRIVNNGKRARKSTVKIATYKRANYDHIKSTKLKTSRMAANRQRPSQGLPKYKTPKYGTGNTDNSKVTGKIKVKAPHKSTVKIASYKKPDYSKAKPKSDRGDPTRAPPGKLKVKAPKKSTIKVTNYKKPNYSNVGGRV